MASFSAGTTFQDNVAGDVTAAKLEALVNAATPTSGLIQDRTAETAIAADDTLLFGDFSDSDNLKRMTVANFRSAATFGTTTSTAATITSGTITTLNSTTGTITTGVIPTLTSTTLITTGTGTAASPAIVPTGDTNTGIFFPAADTIAVTTTGTERLRINSSGNVGIGTTNPSATLHSVSTSASTAAGMFQVTATSSTAIPAISVIKQDSLNSVNQTFVQFNIAAGATGSGQINANGAGLAAFGSFSDLRLKENITALPSQIDNVCALRPCEFDYKDGSGHQIGFIAQEMQEVYPDVIGVDNGMLTITGWSKTEARLVKAIQELKSKNDSLEARLQALETK